MSNLTTLVNATDLITAGHRFSIRDAEVAFNEETGELATLVEVSDLEYCVFEGELPESANKVDTGELLDDTDRWAHLADAHVEGAQADALAAASLPIGDGEEADWDHAAVTRRRRYLALHAWFQRQGRRIAATARKGQRQRAYKLRAKVTAAVKGVRQRYGASVGEVVNVGKERGLPSEEWRWHALYLTKAQVADLVNAGELALRGLRAPTPEPEWHERSIEVLPPGGWNAVLAMALLTA